MKEHTITKNKTGSIPLAYIALAILIAGNLFLMLRGRDPEVSAGRANSVCAAVSGRLEGMTEHCGDLHMLVEESSGIDGSFRSMNGSVAVCEEGSVLAVSPGDTRLIAIDDGKVKYWSVTVNDYQPCVASIGVKLPLSPEKSCTQWSCSAPDAATVDDSGVLIPKAVGECSVTAVDDEGRKYGWKVTVKRTAYITIDDWPNENTNTILDTLKKYDIKATFFLVAQNDNQHLYQRIIDEGHAIGNHTRSHNFDVIYKNSDSLVRSVQSMEDWLLENFKATTKLFRFPGGYYSSTPVKYGAYRMLSDKGYRIYDWTCSVDDVKFTDHDDIMNLFMNTLDEDVEVILMHNSSASAALLDKVINYLFENNYVCLPIDETSPTFDFVHGWSE